MLQLDNLAVKRGLKELEFKVATDNAESKAELVCWVVGIGVLQMIDLNYGAYVEINPFNLAVVGNAVYVQR